MADYIIYNWILFTGCYKYYDLWEHVTLIITLRYNILYYISYE